MSNREEPFIRLVVWRRGAGHWEPKSDYRFKITPRIGEHVALSDSGKGGTQDRCYRIAAIFHHDVPENLCEFIVEGYAVEADELGEVLSRITGDAG